MLELIKNLQWRFKVTILSSVLIICEHYVFMFCLFNDDFYYDCRNSHEIVYEHGR
jgi:hypothetical protein